ncbi:MAG: sigma-70 family RNA polymerase sigma factor, partial [Erysipelotrichales bacterium]
MRRQNNSSDDEFICYDLVVVSTIYDYRASNKQQGGKSMDPELIREAIHGDDEALIICLQLMSLQLTKTAMGLLGDIESAKECIAEMTANVYRHRRQVKQPEYFKTWVIRILINACKDELKRQKKWIELPENFEIAAPTKEDYSFVRDTLDQLPTQLKQILVLKFFQELTFKEVAQTLNLPESTVKSRYSLALKKMRVEME